MEELFRLPVLIGVAFVICASPPAMADGQQWKNDDDYMYQLVSYIGAGQEEVNATVDEILIYKRPERERRWFDVEQLLAMEADFQTVDRREISAILGGVQDYDSLESQDYCYRNNAVWTFHTLMFDYELKRAAYVRISQCAPKSGVSWPRDAGKVVHPAAENTTSTSSRSIIRVLRELGVPGA